MISLFIIPYYKQNKLKTLEIDSKNYLIITSLIVLIVEDRST